jgi:branched-chain amino acid transport system ATP-binding protein
MLVVDDIHTYYGDSYVLQGVSLSVQAGAVVALLGRNGVGKTTLVRSIMGLTPPRRGKVVMEGQDITGLPPHRIARTGIGLVPQGRRIFPSLSVREHLEIAVRKTASGNPWTVERIFELFPNLRERESLPGNKLSGGEQQMLAVGRALVGNPRLVLMDEPSEGLSPLMVREVARLIATLKEIGTAILLVEQKVGFAIAHSDAIHIMNKGRIVQSCSPTELAEDQDMRSRLLGV